MYDPLTVSASATPAPVDFVVTDAKRGRDIPVRVYLPASAKAAPVVVFSHGLGGSKDNNPYLGKHWAARGYVVVVMQHAGSDDTVWQNKPLRDIKPAMQKAAGGENFLLRVNDVTAVLDTLAVWNADAGHALHNRLDLAHIGMSGHSFGAVTIPWCLMTGTKDDAPIGSVDAKSRLAVFPALPPGDKNAKAWLKSDARAVLDKSDTWQTK